MTEEFNRELAKKDLISWAAKIRKIKASMALMEEELTELYMDMNNEFAKIA